MRKFTIAATAAAALTMIAVPGGAQDEAPHAAIVYVDDAVDGPIANALARLDQQHGNSTTATEAWRLFTPEGMDEVDPDCVVVVGRDGDKIAAGLSVSTNGVRVISAQGATRHDTAILAADGLAACHGAG